MIAFVGSVFSPYYHWSGRRAPENHVAFNVALYSPTGDIWTMTERGQKALSRSVDCLAIGPSEIRYVGETVAIVFDEVALPWPGQRLLPRRVQGKISLTPAISTASDYALDPAGHHRWWPKAPSCAVAVECDVFPDGGWQGRGYHDINHGDRPIEQDFEGWDWARGDADADAIVLYDAKLKDGRRRKLGLRFSEDGSVSALDTPERHPLKAGFWGVRGGLACDEGVEPRVRRKLEDTPFYTRSLIETELCGSRITMMHEALDCRRLANPIVRLMLPFKMPRRS